MSTASYQLRVNGRTHDLAEAWVGESLLHVLRERLGLPGSKNACEQGECGSCSVWFDGVLVNACCVLAADAVDAAVTTVEGLAQPAPALGRSSLPPGRSLGPLPGGLGEGLTDVQQAFLDAGAVQCGFCTPGLVVAVTDLLERSPGADDLAIREALSGNLCRCTGYGRVLAAVRRVQAGRR